MKVKLLKKIRRKFRILINDKGNKKIQEKILFRWRDWTDTGSVLENNYVYSNGKVNIEIAFLSILYYRYKGYSRKYKTNILKQDNWTKVWYND